MRAERTSKLYCMLKNLTCTARLSWHLNRHNCTNAMPHNHNCDVDHSCGNNIFQLPLYGTVPPMIIYNSALLLNKEICRLLKNYWLDDCSLFLQNFVCSEKALFFLNIIISVAVEEAQYCFLFFVCG